MYVHTFIYYNEGQVKIIFALMNISPQILTFLVEYFFNSTSKSSLLDLQTTLFYKFNFTI